MSGRATITGRMCGLEGLVLLNGVPVDTWIEAPTVRTLNIGGVARWLRRGENRLRAIVQRGHSEGATQFDVSIRDGRGEPWATLSLDPDAPSMGTPSAAFELEDGAATQLWEDADVLDDAQAYAGAALHLLTEIRGAIVDRDVDHLLRLRRYGLRDEARQRADLFAGRDWTKAARAIHQDVLGDRTLRLEALPSEQVRCELVGEGRILSLWQGVRSSPVRFVDAQGEVATSFEVHLARIGGELRWVR